MVFVQIAIAAPSFVDPGRGLTVFFTFLIHLQNLRDNADGIINACEKIASTCCHSVRTDTSTLSSCYQFQQAQHLEQETYLTLWGTPCWDTRCWKGARGSGRASNRDSLPTL